MSEKTFTAAEVGIMAAVTPLAVAAILLSSIPGAMYSGWVEMKLWNWFVAPYFHIQPISFWVMFGIAAFIGCHGYVDHTKDRKLALVSMYISNFTAPSVLLIIGYLVHNHISK